MAVSPNTTNIAVDKEVADQLRGIAKQVGMTTLECANQLLKFAMSQNELKIEVRQLTINPKSATKAGSKRSK